MRAVMSYIAGTIYSVLEINANGFSRVVEDWKVVGWGDADYRVPNVQTETSGCQTGVFTALMCVSEVRRRVAEGRNKVLAKGRDQYVSLEGILPWDWTSQKQTYIKHKK